MRKPIQPQIPAQQLPSLAERNEDLQVSQDQWNETVTLTPEVRARFIQQAKAWKASKVSQSTVDAIPTEETETEADGVRAEALRRAQVRQLIKKPPGEIPSSKE